MIQGVHAQDGSPENAACRELAAKVMQNIRAHARNRTLVYKLELSTRASAFERDLDTKSGKPSLDQRRRGYAVGMRTGLAGAAAGSPASAVGYFADAAQSFVGVAEASDVWRVSSGSGVSGLMMSAIAAPGGGETLARRGAARARGSGSSRTASARRSRRVGMSPAEQKKLDDIGAKRDEISAWVDRVVLSERPMTTGGTPSGSPATGSRPHATASQCRSLTSMCAPHRREMAQLQWRLA